jgi:hypothetical protein
MQKFCPFFFLHNNSVSTLYHNMTFHVLQDIALSKAQVLMLPQPPSVVQHPKRVDCAQGIFRLYKWSSHYCINTLFGSEDERENFVLLGAGKSIQRSSFGAQNLLKACGMMLPIGAPLSSKEKESEPVLCTKTMMKLLVKRT